MATINAKKIDGIRPMLLTYFSDTKPVSQSVLKVKVEDDTIRCAEKEGFIQLDKTVYCITEKGRKYRDSKE